MKPVRRALLTLVLVFCMAAAAADPPSAPAAGETERLSAIIEELSQLKAQVAAVEQKLETLLRALSEQRGALQNRPAFDILKQSAAAETAADAPDRKPPVVRCAAITNSGKRCTRPAVPGSRYCRQHQLAHQK